MHLARVDLARLSKNDYADNEWGFGQIVALFAWVPLLVELSIPLLISGSRALTPVWTRAKDTVKSKVQKPNNEVEPEQQAQHDLGEQQAQHEVDSAQGGQTGNRVVEDVQVATGIKRRNTPRMKSPV